MGKPHETSPDSLKCKRYRKWTNGVVLMKTYASFIENVHVCNINADCPRFPAKNNRVHVNTPLTENEDV